MGAARRFERHGPFARRSPLPRQSGAVLDPAVHFFFFSPALAPALTLTPAFASPPPLSPSVGSAGAFISNVGGVLGSQSGGGPNPSATNLYSTDPEPPLSPLPCASMRTWCSPLREGVQYESR